MSVFVHGMHPREAYTIHNNSLISLSDLLQLSEDRISSKQKFHSSLGQQNRAPSYAQLLFFHRSKGSHPKTSGCKGYWIDTARELPSSVSWSIAMTENTLVPAQLDQVAGQRSFDFCEPLKQS